MRILIIDNGTERDTRRQIATVTGTLLEAEGHTVGYFSPGAPPSSGVRLMWDMVRPGGFETAVAASIRSFRPDVVHVFDVSPRPAPLVLQEASRRAVPSFWSMTDYNMLCPAGDCRTPRGEICEDCLHGHRRVMARRCVSRDAVSSFAALVSSLYWDGKRVGSCGGVVAVPSSFMRSKLLEFGLSSKRVVTIPLPLAAGRHPLPDSGAGRDDYFAYRGPLTHESGVETLAQAAGDAGVRAVIAGTGELEPRLRQLAQRNPLISIETEADDNVLSRAKGVVVPSESYMCDEDLVKEALSLGTPVIAADIAALTEMLSDDDGVLFTPGNTEELTAVLRDFDKRHAFHPPAIAARAAERYSDKTYLKNLINLYSNWG